MHSQAYGAQMRTSSDIVLYMLAAAVILGGGFGIYDAFVHPASQVGKPGQATLTDRAGGITHIATDRILRVVLIGADDRPGEPGRSDTLMVAYINPALKKIALLSIPRDLRVDIPGHGRTKINHAYAYGGRDLTIETVQNLIDDSIDYSIKINFEGFVKVVDTLGGVYVDIPDVEGPHTRNRHHGMHYDDNWGNLHINLEPGRQLLDGKNALGFVRYRHSKYGFAINDIERAGHQQLFLKELVTQKLRISQVPRLLKAGSQIMNYIETDLSWLEAVDLFKIARTVKPSEIYTVTVPIGDTEIGGTYYSTLLESAFHDEMNKLNDHLHGRTRTDCPVVVYNGCGKAGVAGAAARMLEENGFDDVSTDNAGEFDHQTTAITYTGDTADIAEHAQQALGCGVTAKGQAESGGESAEDKIEIIVGEDFKFTP